MKFPVVVQGSGCAPWFEHGVARLFGRQAWNRAMKYCATEVSLINIVRQFLVMRRNAKGVVFICLLRELGLQVFAS